MCTFHGTGFLFCELAPLIWICAPNFCRSGAPPGRVASDHQQRSTLKISVDFLRIGTCTLVGFFLRRNWRQNSNLSFCYLPLVAINCHHPYSNLRYICSLLQPFCPGWHFPSSSQRTVAPKTCEPPTTGACCELA